MINRIQTCLLMLLLIGSINCYPNTATTDTTNAEIIRFLDSWHLAASEADSIVFFDSIHKDGIYIGTDASERWTKQEFMTFAMPYFRKGKAWSFIPKERDVHVSEDGKYVWFSEVLATWMGTCRGSGILQRQNGHWKIHQYHLSVTVPNELIHEFIKLVESGSRKE